MEKIRNNMVLLIAFAGLLFVPYKLGSDNYFFIPTGTEILENGFPHEDFLSMHEGMHLVVPQWLFTVVMSLLYTWGGVNAVHAFVLMTAAVQIYMIYRLFLISSGNRNLSIGAAAATGILLSPYFTPRPWVVSNTIMILGIMLIEKYIRTRETKWLCWFPLLSLLLINIHASVFPLFLAVVTAYFIAAAVECSGRCRARLSSMFQLHADHIGWKSAAAALVSVLAAAFLNPYGYEAVIYGAVGVLDTSVAGGHVFLPLEMAPLTVYNGFAVLIYMAFSVAAISRSKVPFRYAVMFALTSVMTLMMYRNLFLLLTLGAMGVMHSMQQSRIFDDFPGNVKNPWQLAAALFISAVAICLLRGLFLPVEAATFPWAYASVTVLLMMAFFAAMHRERKGMLLLRAAIAAYVFLMAVSMRYGDSFSTDDHNAYVSRPALDYIESHESDKSKARIWCSANVGSYAEFRGMRPFYDSRVELFAKSVNRKADYRREYDLVESGLVDYMPVFSRHRIDYVLSESDEGISYYRLAQDNRFEMVVDTPQIRLYKIKNSERW